MIQHLYCIYSLLKIHKTGVPLRPITSFINSRSYNLLKRRIYLLSPLVGNTPLFVKSSMGVCQSCLYQTITEDAVLVSFNVASFFIKVQVELTCHMPAGISVYTMMNHWRNILPYHQMRHYSFLNFA